MIARIMRVLPLGLLLAFEGAPSPSGLRICADPNNLPFSNEAREGFENKIATLIGRELHRPIEYVWWAQRRGFVRNTLSAGSCDLVVGTVSGMEMLATTRPYYTSTYVFVSRHDRALDVSSFDDPRLKNLRIGVQLVGDDFANTPPAHALANRGMTRNIVGYTLYGDYRRPHPASQIVDAVARGDVDLAVVWGPLAGYFAASSPVPLRLEPVTPWMDDMQWPMQFDVSVGVRRDNQQLLKDIDSVLARRSGDIRRLLAAYHVPVVTTAK